jgi:hypothetical protein
MRSMASHDKNLSYGSRGRLKISPTDFPAGVDIDRSGHFKAASSYLH